MTNIIPQSPHVNQKAWADFEDYCRELVERRHQVLYIISGPAGRGGVGSKGTAHDRRRQGDGSRQMLEGGRRHRRASGRAGRFVKIGPDTRLIGVIMPNEQSVGHGWAKFRVSVSDVEGLTAYHFFGRVPADVIEPLKARIDTDHIPPSRPRHNGE